MFFRSGYIQFLVCLGLLFSTSTCRPHMRSAGKSRTLSCPARRSQTLNVHHFYSQVLPLLKYYANDTLGKLQTNHNVPRSFDPRTHPADFTICLTSSRSMAQEIGHQLKTYLHTTVGIYSQLKQLQKNLVLPIDAPIKSATNVFLNELQSAVCKIDSSFTVALVEADTGVPNETAFIVEYLTLLLNFSDFLHFVFQNIGM